MQWIFNELATGNYNAEQVRKLAYSKGFKCERNNFWKIIRNPIYCGTIIVPPYEDEEIQFVKGLHEPIISEALFYDVQDVLNGNKKKAMTKAVSPDMLPLRGFLECPDCHRMLTGSASKGRHGNYFHYYHCTGSCKCRFKASTVNDYFENHLLDYQLAPGIREIYKKIVMDVFQSEHHDGTNDRKIIAIQIEEQENMLSNARKRYMTDDIDAEDFKAIKMECNEKLRLLESKLADMPNKELGIKSIEGLLDIVIQRYSGIVVHYKSSSVTDKRKIIGSMYPKNLCFDGKEHRTPHLSEPLSLILQINRHLEGIKKGEKLSLDNLSPLVARRGNQPCF